ncbi:BamA/TamA family outer membrane protein [Octadecabacter sp. G9-8]|uniref:BamA/TamA family outer membrane protein n=1 Tax=Octadecabacter dasysiphoniae TaxID=2909341 RepID=A0ABS9CZ09_9RHOB|nr:BamA/TamA family outer membrane protein [Octadecabacter dasysiphoniae]MCF2872398.1 BamA/TamA family outer membrane protein [Octadecabacter dasysiphoniae]
MRRLGTALALSALIFPLGLTAQNVQLNAPDASESLRTALTAASLTLSLAEDGADAPQDYVAAARADYSRLLTGLYSEGFYGGTISILVDGVEASRLDPLVPRGSVNSVVLSVTPGPRFTFGRAEIEPLARGTALPEAFATGQTARSGVVGDASAAAVDAWRNEGRPLAAPAGQSITARHPDEALDVSVIIDPGPELKFGTVSVEGNEAVRTNRVLAIAGIPSGQFDPAMIDRAEDNLRRTGAFTSATVIEGDAADGDTLPVTLSVVEQTPRRVGIGAEFSSVSGLTLSGFWMHRNLLGGAERLRVEGEVTGLSGGTGGIDYTLGVSFLRPATFRQDVDFYTEATISQLDEPSFFERDVSVEVGIIRRLRDDVILEYGVGFATGEATDALGTRTYSLFSLPIAGTIDRRDDAFDATSGYYANLSIAPFVGLSDTGSGARVVGDARVYRSFGEDDRVTLAARGQIGSVIGADASEVPSSYLFFSGGGGTVRGQAYQSLAVDLGGGNEIGGTAFFATQLEARVDINDTFGVVGFYDAGFVGSDSVPFSDGEWHSGAGIGVRYNTGIGPIRLDLATPVSGDDAGQSLEVYIGIGQAF